MNGGSLRRYSPGPNGPALMIDWFSAAAYCNWLSKQEGVSKSEWCYEPTADNIFGDGMTIPADAICAGLSSSHRGGMGIRLPHQGSQTSRPYGQSIELLAKYAWYQGTSDDRTWPTGSLLPNEPRTL